MSSTIVRDASQNILVQYQSETMNETLGGGKYEPVITGVDKVPDGVKLNSVDLWLLEAIAKGIV